MRTTISKRPEERRARFATYRGELPRPCGLPTHQLSPIRSRPVSDEPVPPGKRRSTTWKELDLGRRANIFRRPKRKNRRHLACGLERTRFSSPSENTAHYFLTVNDIVGIMRASKTFLPGEGIRRRIRSVCYVVGITRSIRPRAILVFRADSFQGALEGRRPAMSIRTFAARRRAVMKDVTAARGRNRAAIIATSSIPPRSASRDVGKALGSNDVCDRVQLARYGVGDAGAQAS